MLHLQRPTTGMSQPTSFFRRFGSTSTSSTSSASSTSSKPFRAAYTLDNCGHDLSYRYSAPKRSTKVMNPFRRAAYTLDGQGYDLSSKYPYAPHNEGNDEPPPSYDWTMEQNGFRSLYTLDWKACSLFKRT